MFVCCTFPSASMPSSPFFQTIFSVIFSGQQHFIFVHVLGQSAAAARQFIDGHSLVRRVFHYNVYSSNRWTQRDANPPPFIPYVALDIENNDGHDWRQLYTGPMYAGRWIYKIGANYVGSHSFFPQLPGGVPPLLAGQRGARCPSASTRRPRASKQLGMSSYENATPIRLLNNVTGQDPGRRRHRLPGRPRSMERLRGYQTLAFLFKFWLNNTYSLSNCRPASTRPETTATYSATIRLFATSWPTWTFRERRPTTYSKSFSTDFTGWRTITRYLRDWNLVGRLLHILQESSTDQQLGSTRETMFPRLAPAQQPPSVSFFFLKCYYYTLL